MIWLMLPISELKRMFPAPADAVKFDAPSTVPDKVRLPPVVARFAFPVRLIVLANEIGAFAVKSVPVRETEPPPLWVNGPLIEVLAPAFRVRELLFEIATGPPAAVMRLPLIEKEFPVSEIPPARLVFMDPKVVSPVPVVCVIVVAVILGAVIVSPAIVKVPSRVFPPTFPEKVT